MCRARGNLPCESCKFLFIFPIINLFRAVGCYQIIVLQFLLTRMLSNSYVSKDIKIETIECLKIQLKEKI